MTKIKDNQAISVIGAGVLGALSAYNLSRSLPAAEITLYDPKGFPADNASFIAGGMIAPLSELDHMPISYLEAGFESLRIWSQMNEDLNSDFEFAQKGSLFIAHDEDRQMLERFKSILPTQDDLWSELTQSDIEELEPALAAQPFHRALYMHGEGHLNPRKILKILCDQIRQKKKSSIDVSKEAQRADWVIDCRGMAADDDILGLRGVKGEVLLVRNPGFHLSRPVRLMHPRYPLYIIPREDHHFLIGATIIESRDDTVSLRSSMVLMSALYSLHRSFGDAQIIEMRADARPSYSDNLPRIEVQENIIRANGLYRHGFLFSPVMSMCVKDIVTGQENEFFPLFMKDQNDENHTQRCAANM